MPYRRGRGRSSAGRPDRPPRFLSRRELAHVWFHEEYEPTVEALREHGLGGGGTETERYMRAAISGRHEPGSRRARKRQARYRTGIEGRISHLKRGWGLRRRRLKGHDGQQANTGWGVLTYSLDTLAIRTA